MSTYSAGAKVGERGGRGIRGYFSSNKGSCHRRVCICRPCHVKRSTWDGRRHNHVQPEPKLPDVQAYVAACHPTFSFFHPNFPFCQQTFFFGPSAFQMRMQERAWTFRHIVRRVKRMKLRVVFFNCRSVRALTVATISSERVRIRVLWVKSPRAAAGTARLT
jgi:hypothetical protein